MPKLLTTQGQRKITKLPTLTIVKSASIDGCCTVSLTTDERWGIARRPGVTRTFPSFPHERIGMLQYLHIWDADGVRRRGSGICMLGAGWRSMELMR